MQTSPGADSPEPRDGELVLEAKAGAREAFGRLVRRYQGMAVARAYAVLHDRGEAEDSAQEAFLRAFRVLDQLRQPEAFAPWLLQIVVNIARRAAAKRARRPAALLDPDPGSHPSPRADVTDAVAALPEGYQQVIHLHYAQGYSCAEIGRLLGLEVGSVTSRLSRARRMLREMLSEEHDTE